MRSKTAALPSSWLLSLTQETGGGLSQQVCLTLVIRFSSLPRQPRLNSLTADWINREEKLCCTTGEREQNSNYSISGRFAFRHLRQHAGAQRGLLMSTWLERQETKAENSVWKLENIKEKASICVVQADRSKWAESALKILIWQSGRINEKRENIRGKDWQLCQNVLYIDSCLFFNVYHFLRAFK